MDSISLPLIATSHECLRHPVLCCDGRCFNVAFLTSRDGACNFVSTVRDWASRWDLVPSDSQSSLTSSVLSASSPFFTTFDVDVDVDIDEHILQTRHAGRWVGSLHDELCTDVHAPRPNLVQSMPLL